MCNWEEQILKRSPIVNGQIVQNVLEIRWMCGKKKGKSKFFRGSNGHRQLILSVRLLKASYRSSNRLCSNRDGWEGGLTENVFNDGQHFSQQLLIGCL